MLRVFLKKNFWKNENVSCVEEWIALIHQQHPVQEAFKLYAAFALDLKLVFTQMTLAPVGLQKVFANRRVLLFDKVLVKMSRSIANMIRIAQIISRINHELLIND